ncbi:MAG: ABC transporter permease [Bacteroidales bacterium]|nr:ABC transporter permease [Bacteroidales bacterium]
MISYIIRKLLYSLLVVWGVVTIVFLIFNILPGDPARMMVGQRADEATVEAIRDELGLNEPVIKQYLGYLNNLSPISYHTFDRENNLFYLEPGKYDSPKILVGKVDAWAVIIKAPYMGKSFQSRKSVTRIILDALPNSLILAFVSILLGTILGILTGIFAAIWKDSLFDRLALFFSALGMSLPSFFAAIIIGWIFAYLLSDFTGLNLTGNLYEVDDLGGGVRLVLKNLILPSLTLAIRPLSVIMQLSRNSLLDVLSQDYIRTAWSKGLSYSGIIYRHALRNALNPVITAISGWFASLMAGVIFVEYIFGWKGLGFLIVNALNNYDFPLVLGSVVFISIIFVIINILVDFTYAIIDPRVRK